MEWNENTRRFVIVLIIPRANQHGFQRGRTDSRCERRGLPAAPEAGYERHAVGNESCWRGGAYAVGGGFMRPNFPLSSRLKSEGKVKQMNLISLTKFASSLQS